MFLFYQDISSHEICSILPKNIGTKKVWVPKKSGYRKNLGSKRIWVPKIILQQIILGTK